jgi:transcriptional regulator with XRE-family HTH domain
MQSLRSDCSRARNPGFTAQVGERIRAFRQSRRVSQQALASRVELVPYRLSRYETGANAPTLKCLYRIAEALGCPVEPLLPEMVTLPPIDLELHRIYRLLWSAPPHHRAIVVSFLRLLNQFLSEQVDPRSAVAGVSHATSRH